MRKILSPRQRRSASSLRRREWKEFQCFSYSALIYYTRCAIPDMRIGCFIVTEYRKTFP